MKGNSIKDKTTDTVDKVNHFNQVNSRIQDFLLSHLPMKIVFGQKNITINKFPNILLYIVAFFSVNKLYKQYFKFCFQRQVSAY